MLLTTHTIAVGLVACAMLLQTEAQIRHSKRRTGPRKPVFNFPLPRSSPVARESPATRRPSPLPLESSVEVQRAEVHSEEFLGNQELQPPFRGDVQVESHGFVPDFDDEPAPRPPVQRPKQLNSNSHGFRLGTTTPLPKEAPTHIPILRLEKQQALDGSYKSNYETGNSIHAEETGFVKNLGVKDKEETLVQYGSYSYTDPDGKLVSVKYTADEGGFRAVGAHLPTPPPVPPEVQKGLDIIFESIRREGVSELGEREKVELVPSSRLEDEKAVEILNDSIGAPKSLQEHDLRAAGFWGFVFPTRRR